jgi:hypothetical protein
MVKIISKLPSYQEFRKIFAKVRGHRACQCIAIEFDDDGYRTEGMVDMRFHDWSEESYCSIGVETVKADCCEELAIVRFEGRAAYRLFTRTLQEACDELPKDDCYQLAKAAWLAKDLQRQLHEHIASPATTKTGGRL